MSGFFDLLLLTLRDPGAALADLRRRGVGIPQSWTLLVVAAAVGAMLAWLLRGPDPGGSPIYSSLWQLAGQPIPSAVVQLFSGGLFALLLDRVGRLFRGEGDFEASLRAVAWLEVVMLTLQLVQLVVALILPFVAGLVGIAIIVTYIYLAVRFAQAVHGFRSPLMVAMGIFGTMLLTGIVLSVLATALGLTPEIPL
ncbi:MAG: hypothetical protein DI498_10450 [Paracoccus denitrificans]|nr:MAG: hypothetical protein DI498_10450 [Paracoccus denitrificans]PZO83722.1 MAG: hypothetical protein DI633_10450 [Paracoccus denitrificans]